LRRRDADARRWFFLNLPGGRPKSGINKASRELGIDKNEAYRAVKIASLTPEAKKVAVEVGLDDNKSGLLAAAKQAPEQQAQRTHQIAQAKAAEPAMPKTTGGNLRIDLRAHKAALTSRPRH
jgi:hypothetical protein